MQSVVLEAKRVSKYFGRGRRKVFALKDTSISLRKGEISLLMGPSGSGKSSLIAALSGLQAPDTGTVLGPDGDLWRRSEGKLTKFRREYCGFVFQSVGLFPSLNALQQVIFPLTLIGVPRNEARKRANETLDWVGLHNQKDSLPSQMSGGENQRVAIARMLAKKPSLIFCDEPTSALDKESGSNVVRLLRKAAKESDAMVLCATHDGRILPFADRVIHMEDGEVLSDTISRQRP